MTELHRVYLGSIQQVEVAVKSLHCHGAYILIDKQANIAGSWAGPSCRQIDKLLAETLAAKILQTECRKSTADDSHIMVNKVHPIAPPDFFLQAINMTAQDYISMLPSLPTNEIIIDPNRLYSVKLSRNDAESTRPTIKLIEEKIPDEHVTGRFLFSSFSSDKIILTECGPFDRVLWIGGKYSQTEIRQVKDYVKNTRGDFVTERDKLESILFKEKFANVGDAFGRKSVSGSSPVRKGPNLQSIDAEARRMVNGNFGTLAMLGDSGGPVGDCSRPGLYMNYADDLDGQLFVYQVNSIGKSRTLVAYQEDESLPVVFFSNGAYAVLYTCKNASRAIVYLWVGQDCPADMQAALALRCKEIFPPGLSPDQLQVQQGREPQLLLRIISTKRLYPLCILSSNSSIQENNISILLEVSTTDILLPRQSPIALELSVHESAPLCSRNARIHISAITKSHGESRILTDMKTHVMYGHSSDIGVRDSSRRLSSAASEIIRLCFINNTGKTSYIGSPNAGTLSMSSLGCIEFSPTLKPKISDQIESGFCFRPASRPLRLFQVSQSRRSVGAMFVEEIGIGGVFSRVDLSGSDCYILDGGRDTLYVWIGQDCLYHAMALATRVARRLVSYISEIADALSNPCNPSKPYDPCQLHFENYFKVDRDSPLRIEYLYEKKESNDFIGFFRDWNTKSVASPLGSETSFKRKQDVLFDPLTLDDDEEKDIERDSDGRLLTDSSKIKLKYSETEDYRRNSVARQEKITRRSSTGENFASIKLKSTPGSTSGDDCSIRSSPLSSSARTPVNRRSSTGSASHMAPSLIGEKGGRIEPVDHFLKVKLRKVGNSSMFIETTPERDAKFDKPSHVFETPPLELRSNIIGDPSFCTDDTLSPSITPNVTPTVASTKSEKSNDEKRQLPAAIEDNKGNYCKPNATAIEANSKMVPQRYTEGTLSSVPLDGAAKSGTSTTEDIQNLDGPAAVSPVSTFKIDLDLKRTTDSRPASTGSHHTLTNSYVPKQTAREDFRNIKLKKTDISYSKVPQESVMHDFDGVRNLANERKNHGRNIAKEGGGEDGHQCQSTINKTSDFRVESLLEIGKIEQKQEEAPRAGCCTIM